MKFHEWNATNSKCLFDSNPNHMQSFNFSGNSYNVTKNSSSLGKCDQQAKSSLLEALCKVFQNNTSSLNSPFYKLNQDEFFKVKTSLSHYKSCLPTTETAEWIIESGESSNCLMPQTEATKERLVCYFLTKQHKVVGKFVVSNPENKLVIPRKSVDKGNSNLQLLKNMNQLSSATIKDRYKAPFNHSNLSDIEFTSNRLQIFGVVTAVNKLPTKTTSSWHSLICISDPSLIVIACDDEEEEDNAPGEFKMSLFFNILEDHPEFHRGDVVRFTNVKIETHKNRCDGRVFNKTDVTVYCHPDSKAPVLRESFEDRAAVVRVLSHWWTLNHRFFDCLTPHPIYHLLSRYPGIRTFRELSHELICDLYCQVVSISDDSSDLNFLCVRDGTIFTLQKQPTTNQSEPEIEPINTNPNERKPSFGFLGLAIFEPEHWKTIKTQNILVNDYVIMREVKVVFLTEETLANLRSYYAYHHPCVLFRPVADKVKKIPANHHEAYKIRSRLHRLPENLELMNSWKFPLQIEEKVPEDPLLVRLNDSSVQMNILKRLKRS